MLRHAREARWGGGAAGKGEDKPGGGGGRRACDLQFVDVENLDPLLHHELELEEPHRRGAAGMGRGRERGREVSGRQLPQPGDGVRRRASGRRGAPGAPVLLVRLAVGEKKARVLVLDLSSAALLLGGPLVRPKDGAHVPAPKVWGRRRRRLAGRAREEHWSRGSAARAPPEGRTWREGP